MNLFYFLLEESTWRMASVFFYLIWFYLPKLSMNILIFALLWHFLFIIKISILFNAANCVREFGVNMLIASRGNLDIN